MNRSRFSTFLETFDSQSQRRGRQWEEVCQWFLQTDPVYSAQLTKVWLWDKWPGRWGPDAGIDLVAKARDGTLWAIQAKAYAEKTSVTKHDVDTFLSESARSAFSYRLLIATTSRVARAAQQAMAAQEKPVIMLLRHDLERRESLTWPVSFAAWKRGQVPTRRPKRPRPHQRKALRAAMTQLARHDRGQLVLACGTGKTLVALWLHERLEAKRTLVLVPSLSLLKQTLQEWVANSSHPFEVLPVCSDDTVRPDERDAVVSSVTELGFPATTAKHEVQEFLRRRGPRVVFSTYQSSPVIAEALEGTRLRFDLAIADEAHRCAGPASSEFATVLDQSRIPVRKRVFMTATPRYFTGRVVKAAREEDLEVASMDDEAVFGPVMHRLSFAQAIEEDLLSDYRVLVVGIDDARYRRYADRGRVLTLDGQQTTDARSLASHIGVAKAMRRYDIHRLLTFHGRVAAAQRFARTLPDVIQWMPSAERPSGPVWAKPVSGAMSSGERAVQLDRLREVEAGERGVLSNARCLGEGVDIPTLDGVAFIDPKHSQVDIVQAVGRALRKGEGKGVATIVIPVFVDPTAEAEHALDASAFRAIAAVLRALRDHDEALAEELDALRRELGRRSRYRLRLPQKIVLDLPRNVGSDFSTAIATKAVRLTTASWEEYFEQLRQYVKTHGHARVPAKHTTAQDDKLGSWVNRQRTRKSGLSPEQRTRLEALDGWMWDPFDAAWEDSYRQLRHYVQTEGHARVPQSYTTPDGLRLGSWVTTQRAKKEKLSAERRNRLESVDGWAWDAVDAAWEESFTQLQQHVKTHGHARVPPSYLTGDGHRLGSWVVTQRARKKQLSSERRTRLEALTGWVWETLETRWDERFTQLQQFVATHGHARVPGSYLTGDGHRLGRWVVKQRVRKEQLSSERRTRLEDLTGWVWDTLETRWDERFTQLQQFVATHGHARVPAKHTTPDGSKLGAWVSNRRARKKEKRLSAEQQERLESLNGWVWDPFDALWEEGFRQLQQFVATHGHARVLGSFTTSDGHKLGPWVIQQRGNTKQLSSERRTRLEALTGWVWDTLETRWDERFTQLQQFEATHGHARVPRSYTTPEGDQRLGSWVTTQRATKEQMSPQRRERLESLNGWVWDPFDALWEEGFTQLQQFVATHSHARVPASFTTSDGYRLGTWVVTRRTKKERLSPVRQARLESVDGWVWDRHAARWEEGFAQLQHYVKTEGHARVPASYRTPDGHSLGAWVSAQRSKKEKLSPQRQKRLESVDGWAWDAREK